MYRSFIGYLSTTKSRQENPQYNNLIFNLGIHIGDICPKQSNYTRDLAKILFVKTKT